MNEVRRFQLKCLIAIAALAVILASSVIQANDEPENPRPSGARISGNTWCGPMLRSANDPLYAIFGDLARYVDAGATVIGYAANEQTGSERFVLCGSVRGKDSN
jgi:hypothetical protein